MIADRPIELLSATQSVCPVCLQRVAAIREQQGDTVYLVKQCPQHGTFRTAIWRGAVPFSTWLRPKQPASPRQAFTAVARGCPFDCGLCPDHGQHTCTALIEITGRCNLRCPVCFADAGEAGADAEPSLARIGFFYDRILAASGPCNIQLSGGEPTLRADLGAIISLGRDKGFAFIQLNSNGLRLGQEPEYAAELKAAGLASVFLQFDGLTAPVHRSLRGRDDLGPIKEQAIRHCAAAGLAVVLVPTLVPGVNTREIGAIIDYATRFAPTVRGVHFQPISYFGRYLQPPADQDRLTLPELLQLIEEQSHGTLRAEHFAPPGCEHALCSFHGNFLIGEGCLQPLGGGGTCCATGEPATLPTALEGREKSVAFTARQWSLPQAAAVPCGCSPERAAPASDDLDRFLARARTHTFSLSAMAFQDAWNLDLERLRGCCIHVVSPQGNLIPFCAWNLTTNLGAPLYRRTMPP